MIIYQECFVSLLSAPKNRIGGTQVKSRDKTSGAEASEKGGWAHAIIQSRAR